MIRPMMVGLLSVTFLLAGLSVAQDPPGGDDPPVRLKKKPRPEAGDQPKEEQPKPAEPPKEQPKEPKEPKDPKKEEPKEGDDGDKPEQPEMDEGEVLNRVSKNMRTSEDRIDRAELNDSTRQVQDDILKDLDSLINQEKNGGGGGGADQQNQQNQDDRQNQGGEKNQSGQKNQGGGQAKIGMGKPKSRLKGSQQQQAKGGQGKKQGGGQKPEQQVAQGEPAHQGGGGQQKPDPNQQNGNQGGGGGKSQGEPGKLAEVYKDVWGHLPETMRAEMNAYSREQFMAKYNDLIKQYYSDVAQKSRKKD